jgi:hypothetical protein|tara:strand:- start:111 stop:392 length:282 start_codon:yes stop_codon:yes gene_type:complete
MKKRKSKATPKKSTSNNLNIILLIVLIASILFISYSITVSSKQSNSDEGLFSFSLFPDDSSQKSSEYNPKCKEDKDCEDNHICDETRLCLFIG